MQKTADRCIIMKTCGPHGLPSFFPPWLPSMTHASSIKRPKNEAFLAHTQIPCTLFFFLKMTVGDFLLTERIVVVTGGGSGTKKANQTP